MRRAGEARCRRGSRARDLRRRCGDARRARLDVRDVALPPAQLAGPGPTSGGLLSSVGRRGSTHPTARPTRRPSAGSRRTRQTCTTIPPPRPLSRPRPQPRPRHAALPRGRDGVPTGWAASRRARRASRTLAEIETACRRWSEVGHHPCASMTRRGGACITSRRRSPRPTDSRRLTARAAPSRSPRRPRSASTLRNGGSLQSAASGGGGYELAVVALHEIAATRLACRTTHDDPTAVNLAWPFYAAGRVTLAASDNDDR